MKRFVLLTTGLMACTFCFCQISNMRVSTREEIIVAPISAPTAEVPVPPPDATDSDYMKNLYLHLQSFMNTKATAMESGIKADFNQRIEKKRQEMTQETGVENLQRIAKEIETLEADMRKKIQVEVGYLKGLSKEYSFKARTLGFVIVTSKNRRVSNAHEAQVYYNLSVSERSARFLGNSLLSISSEGERISLFNEIYSDYFGPFRFGVGALVGNRSNSSDSLETEKDAIQRLLGGGGNMIINLNYPIVGFTGENNRFIVKSSFAPKLAVDLPVLGTESDKYGLNYDIGFEATILFSGLLNVLTFYTNSRFAIINGNDVFFDNLNKDKGSFAFHQLSIGLALNSTFRLAWNTYFGSDFVKENFPSTVSFSVIPN